jgi:hypothetical protein
MANNRQQVQRKPRGVGKRFVKGESGNPRGRVPGSRNRVTILAESIMEAGAEQITNAVVSAAAGGDMTAARIVLDRIAPPRRGRPVEFPLCKIETAGDVVAALGSIAAAMTDGTLTPDEAQAVAAVIELKRRAIETVEFERRLAALEEKEKEKK